jgi:hypothetical protein
VITKTGNFNALFGRKYGILYVKAARQQLYLKLNVENLVKLFCGCILIECRKSWSKSRKSNIVSLNSVAQRHRIVLSLELFEILSGGVQRPAEIPREFPERVPDINVERTAL